MIIKEYSLTLLQKAINKALAMDEQTSAKLKSMEGKLLQIIIKPLQVSFFIAFKQGTVVLTRSSSQTADTVIESNPLGLIRLAILPTSRARSLFNDHIQLSGDTELGQQVKQLFDELDIDWEGHLALLTGDVVAYQIGSMFRKAKTFKKKLVKSFGNNITEYLQEELRCLPSPEEVNDFYDDVDKLNDDFERLAQHIHCVKSALGTPKQ